MRGMCGIEKNIDGRIVAEWMVVARMVALTDYPWRCRAVGANRNGVTRKCNSIAASKKYNTIAASKKNNSIAALSAKGATSQRVVREGYRMIMMARMITRIYPKNIRNILIILFSHLLTLPATAQIRDDYDSTKKPTDSTVVAAALQLQGRLIDPVYVAQIRDDYDYLKVPTLLSAANRHDTTHHKFAARFYGHTFFKNNEYFGDFVKGYTLTGYHLQPEFSYSPNRKLKVQALWDVLKYHGYDKFSKNKPYFRIVFQPTDSFRIICGYLDGNVRHGLIEPIYDPERYLTADMENGLQINLLRPHYDGELWLNWEKMILWGDPWQERLTVGHVSKFHVANKPRFKSDIIGEFLVAHRGGQIDSCDGQVQSLMNAALGMDFHWTGNGGGVFKQLSVRAMAVGYHAIDETPDLPWKDGAGTFVKTHLRLADFGLTLGHWFGYRFVNFRGDLLYTGWAIDPENNRQHRYMAFFGGYYSKRYFDDTFVLRTGVDAWYDLATGNLEYSYMLSMAVNYHRAFSRR